MVELFAARFRQELVFKELKSELGTDHYQFQKFVAVENWIQVCVLTFAYLEFYRLGRLNRGQLGIESRAWWRGQRTCGLSWQVRRDIKLADLEWIIGKCQSQEGCEEVRRCLKGALPKDQTPVSDEDVWQFQQAA